MVILHIHTYVKWLRQANYHHILTELLIVCKETPEIYCLSIFPVLSTGGEWQVLDEWMTDWRWTEDAQTLGTRIRIRIYFLWNSSPMCPLPDASTSGFTEAFIKVSLSGRFSSRRADSFLNWLLIPVRLCLYCLKALYKVKQNYPLNNLFL